MRTYSAEKRYGIPIRMFSNAKTEEKGRFDFFEFLTSDENAAASESFTEFIRSMKHEDGSYAEDEESHANSGLGFYATCRALCAMKSLGLDVEKGTIDYVERMKNDDDGGFRPGPERDEGTIESTYWAALALRLCGKPVPPESVEYIKSFREKRGGYGTLGRTYMALTVLKAAGCGLSEKEGRETIDRVASAFLESDKDITDCYDAVVSMNMLGAELPSGIKDALSERVEELEPDSENEDFKLSVIRRCIGEHPAGMRPSATSVVVAESMNELCHALWTGKLEAYCGR